MRQHGGSSPTSIAKPLTRPRAHREQSIPARWELELPPASGTRAGLETAETSPLYAASELPEAVELLAGFAPEELDDIPVLTSGAPLDPGASYIDLRALERGVFTATQDFAPADSLWVSKTDVAYPLWLRLVADAPNR